MSSKQTTFTPIIINWKQAALIVLNAYNIFCRGTELKADDIQRIDSEPEAGDKHCNYTKLEAFDIHCNGNELKADDILYSRTEFKPARYFHKPNKPTKNSLSRRHPVYL